MRESRMSGGSEALLPMGSEAGPGFHHKHRVLGPASSSSASPSFLNSPPSVSSLPSPGRLLDRDGPFRQSLGRMRVARQNRPRSLAALDWLHTLLHQSTYKLLIGVAVAYVGIVLMYAPLFLAINDDADLGLRGFGEAASLSLTTLMTIGYGLRSSKDGAYMSGSWAAFWVVTSESMLGLFLDAVVIGGVWLRISRPQPRARTVVFSDKAVVREIRGALYFMFQVAELRKHQLVEAHVRLYCLRKRPSFATSSMRTQRPDDELGAMLLLALPSVVVHRIDSWSPLSPPPLPPSSSGAGTGGHSGGMVRAPHDPTRAYRFPDVQQRANDAEAGGRELRELAGGGVSGSGDDDSNGSGDDSEGGNDASSSSSSSSGSSSRSSSSSGSKARIKSWIEDGDCEVLVLVEGVEQMTGCSVQARHSYTPEDLVWDASFPPCVFSAADTRAASGAATSPANGGELGGADAAGAGGCRIDFSRFHDTIPVGDRDAAAVEHDDLFFFSHA